MAWIAKKNGKTQGPYPDDMIDELKGHAAMGGWTWERIEDPVFTPPIKPKAGKKKVKESETMENESEGQKSN